MDKRTGIILEGGAMRSIFTAGIMDFFLDKGIHIPNVLAVSAGAYAGMNYVSGQKGRIIDSVVKPMGSHQVLGPKVLLKTGEFFNMDLLFDKIPKVTCPFDFESFKASGKRFLTSTINCLTGELVYYDSFESLDHFLNVCRCAASLPLLSKVGYVDGTPMLDGGMADALPIDKAIEEGWEKIIVVFTREASYRKSPKGDIYNSRLVKWIYRKYPGLLAAIDKRPAKYNDSIEKMNRLEKEGRVFILRPEDIVLSNNESDPEVLTHFYESGYQHADRRYKDLLEFLNA